MIIYNNDKELITTTIGDITQNPRMSSFYLTAESFRGKETRFFKIISKDVITRNIKHIINESMAKEAKRRFRKITNIYNSNEYYDKEHNIGYKVFPYMKNPTIYSYSMIYPAITEFFQYWKKFNCTGISKKDFIPHYDLSKLFVSMANFKDLEILFKKQQNKSLKNALYQEFPQFAIFYYEIYPYLNLETVNCYDISKLINARIQVKELGLDTTQLDALEENLKVSQNNTKVLNLIKK